MSKGLTFNVIGLETVLDAVNNFGRRVEAASARAARSEAEYELPLMQELVPVNTGALRDSGEVVPVEFAGIEIASGVSFGNDQVDYAMAVHEDLEAYHPHGQAKFAESVARDEMESGRAAERMAAEIVQRLGL